MSNYSNPLYQGALNQGLQQLILTTNSVAPPASVPDIATMAAAIEKRFREETDRMLVEAMVYGTAFRKVTKADVMAAPKDEPVSRAIAANHSQRTSNGRPLRYIPILK